MSASRDEADRSQASDPSHPLDDVSHQRIGHYELRKRIGSGGMGTVFLAYDTRLNRTLALKVLPREKAKNPILVRRFKSEATQAAQLVHENIMSVFDAGEVDGLCYIAMEYIDGIDVYDLVKRRGVIPVKRSIDIVKQTARALQHAYEKGIVHRDVKPSNLLIRRDGVVKLADMGLARSIDESAQTSITRAGTTVGTVDYMAPEQARDSKSADVRSDIYSLGCTWYHMLTAEPPFPEGSLTNKLRAHAQVPLPDPRLKNPQVPEAVLAILNRMTAKNPKDRYQTPAELIEDLESAHLNSEAFSEKILEALVTEERGGKSAPSTPSTPSGPRVLPPKSRVEPTDPEAEIPRPWYPQIQSKLLVYVALVVGIAFLIVKVTNMAQRYAGFDSSVAVNPFNQLDGGTSNSATQRAGSANDAEPEGADTEPVTTEEPEQAPKKVPVRAVDITQIPPWVDRPIATANLMQVPVRGDDGGQSAASTLDEAIHRLPSSGGVIQLTGSGPFVLRPIRSNQKLIFIQAVGGSRPLIVLRPADEGAPEVVLHQTGGTLRLEGLDLLANAAQFPGESPLEFIRVTGGDLCVKDCSFSVRGARAGRISAVRLDGAARHSSIDAPRVQIDRCSFRGTNLIAMDIDAEAVDVFVRDSLLVTGSAPALNVRGSYQSEEGSSRLFRFFSSTLSSQKNAFELAASGADSPISTGLYFQNSLVAATGGNAEPNLLSLENWPRSPAGTKPLYRNLDWKSKNSVFMGWKRLIDVKLDEVASVDDVFQFRKMWQVEMPAESFAKSGWPLGAVADPVELPLSLWAPEGAVALGAKTEDGQLAGCDITALYRPDFPPMTATLIRPPRPVRPEPFVSLKTVNVDLTREDLGRAISGKDWKDGTTFVAAGYGLRHSSPIVIVGKSCQIVFEQTEGVPLSLAPRSTEGTKPAGSVDHALFSVSGGSVEIVNGTFTMPAGDRSKGVAAPLFLHATGGGFVLRKCRVQSSGLSSGPGQGLIQWEPAGTAQSSSAAEASANCAVIEDSFLVGGGPLLTAELNRGALLLRNSVFASIEDLFEFDLGTAFSKQVSAIDAEHCTFSARGTFFQVRAKVAESSTGGLAIFANNCVFAPPLREGPGSAMPTLLTYTGKLLDAKKIDWWESGCGYAPEILTFLRPETVPPGNTPQKFDEVWTGYWGGQHVRNPLTVGGGVLLKDALPQRGPLKPEHFELHPKSDAFTWADGGAAIGPDISTLEPPKTKPAEKTIKKPAPSKASPKSKKPLPNKVPGL